MGHAAELDRPADHGDDGTMRMRVKNFPLSVATRDFHRAFALPELLMVLAALMLAFAVLVPMWTGARARSRLAQCTDNLRRVNGAVLTYAEKNNGRLPEDDPSAKGAVWWFYKEAVKGELELKGPSSPADKV